MITWLLRLFIVPQASSFCVRDGHEGRELLLVMSRSGNRWTCPKGTVEGDETSAEAARREAFEEAGVDGAVCASSLGHYIYRKRGHWRPRRVAIHIMRVESESTDYPEAGDRARQWFPVQRGIAELKAPVRRIVRRDKALALHV